MRQLLEQLRAVWTQGSPSQRASLAVGLLVVLATASVSAYLATRPDWALLFGNLEPADAALVVEKVRSLGSDAEVRDGGRSVYVPRSRVAELRMQVSAAGLPHGGGRGWELFDDTGFGVSEFVQNVNLRRALEGELARSIRSFDAVESAQVRISPAKRSPFVSRDEPAKASVVVHTVGGRRLSEEHVRAIQHLVAGAVAELDPEAVRVLDTSGRLLSREVTDELARDAEGQLDFRRKEEEYRRRKAQALLDALPVRGEVQVSLELDFQRIQETSETVDPQGTVLTETIETRSSTSARRGADPSTKSQVSGQVATAAAVPNEETEETTKTEYVVGKKVRNESIEAPRIKQMSVSLVVAKEQEERLSELEDLVKAAVGFVEGRDVIRSMVYEFPEQEAPVVETAGPDPLLVREIAERAIQVVGILGALFLLWKVLRTSEAKRKPEPSPERQVDATPPVEPVPATAAGEPEPLREAVRRVVEEDPARAAQVLHGWLHAGEEG